LTMQIGILARTFVRPTLTAMLDAVKAHGLNYVQFNLACAGLPPMPDRIDPELCDRIRQEMVARNLTMVAVSGTFNMIHPDLSQRQRGLRRLAVLAAACRRLGTSVITLCTGTRDADDKWRYHPDNASPEAWRDLVVAMQTALQIAHEQDVTLAIEPLGPEEGDFLRTAPLGIELIEMIGSPQVRLHLDCKAMSSESEPIPQIIRLGGDLLAHFHANDPNRQGPGFGRVDFVPILEALGRIDYRGWVSVEVFDYTPGIERLARESIRYMQECLQRLAE